MTAVEKSMRRRLEKKRYFEDGQIGAFVVLVEQESPFGGADAGVNDGLKLLQLFWRGEDLRGQSRAIDHAIPDRAGKHHLDQRRSFTGVKIVNDFVGVQDRNALIAKVGRDRALTHPDRACETCDDHVWAFSRAWMAASTALRSSGVTSGRTPNHLSKPGTA